MKPTETAYFTGRWTEDERRAVEAATRQIEEKQPYDPFIERLGCPWACTTIEVRGEPYFMAHWARRPGQVFRATSADSLAAQIRTARSLMPNPPGPQHRASA